MIELLATFNKAVNPALLLLPAKMDTPKARALLWSIARQESRLTHRFQIVEGNPKAKGPAKGLWQFERGGGVAGVLQHPETRKLAFGLCLARQVSPLPSTVHSRLEFDDVLAAGFARLLLYSDPTPLPEVSASPGATWEYYFRNWRPGKPHRDTWNNFHNEAVSLFSSGVAR